MSLVDPFHNDDDIRLAAIRAYGAVRAFKDLPSLDASAERAINRILAILEPAMPAHVRQAADEFTKMYAV